MAPIERDQLEQNKLVVLRLYDALCSRVHPGVASDLVAADFVEHGAPAGAPCGPAALLAGVARLRETVPDGRYVLEDLIAEDDRVAVRLTFAGTLSGSWAGTASRGQRTAQAQIHIVRVAGGKGVERWVVPQDAAFWRR